MKIANLVLIASVFASSTALAATNATCTASEKKDNVTSASRAAVEQKVQLVLNTSGAPKAAAQTGNKATQ